MGLKLIKLADLEEDTDEKWLFYPYIPYGDFTILHGEPGAGKTRFMLKIIGGLTSGEELFPFENIWDINKREPIDVIYQNADDGLGDTIKPLLLAADADCDRVYVIDDYNRPLHVMDGRLEQALTATGAKMIVLDPIQAYTGSIDLSRSDEARRVINRISLIANVFQCAVVLIDYHPTRKGLSSEFYESAGSVLRIYRDEKISFVRFIEQTKNVYIPNGKRLHFTI